MNLETSRLILRPLTLEDAPRIQKLCNEPEIAEMTLSIPHPYPLEAATTWIESHPKRAPGTGDGTYIGFAICEKVTAFGKSAPGEIMGCISFEIQPAHKRGMLGYWMGKPYWNKGYCTEANKRMIEYGFSQLGFIRIYAFYDAKNPASGRVMEKSGMEREGYFKSHVLKNGVPRDSIFYAIVKPLT